MPLLVLGFPRTAGAYTKGQGAGMTRFERAARAYTIRRAAFTVCTTAGILGLAGCGGQSPPEPVEEGVVVVEEPGGPQLVEWVAYQEANSSLREAERRLIGEESEGLSAALGRAAHHFEQLAAMAKGEDAARLRASATELENLSTDFPEDLVTHRRVLGEVEGRALIALSRHHLLRAGRLAGEGEGKMAARHFLTAANDISEGFRVAAVEMPSTTGASLDSIRIRSEGWMDGIALDTQAAAEAQRAVGEEADRLANALGARRR